MKTYQFISVAACLLCLGASATAFAQDPFSAYEGGAKPAPVVQEQVTEEVVTQTTPAPAPAPIAPVAPPAALAPVAAPAAAPAAVAAPEFVPSDVEEDVVDALVKAEDLVKEGRFTLHSNLGFALDYSTNRLPNDKSSNTASFFTRLDVGAGYNLMDRVTLEVSAGAILKNNQRISDNATEHDWVFQANGFYSYPIEGLGNRALLIGGGGLGAYFGGFETKVEGSPQDYDASTAGFIANLKGGVSYMFASNWNMRLLLDGTLMVGPVSLGGQSFLSTTSHLGIDLGVTYTF